MTGWKKALLAVAQVVLLLAYLPMAFGLWAAAYGHLPHASFDLLPVRVGIAWLPQLAVLSPLLYASLRSQGRVGTVGLLIVAWCLVSTACWLIVDPAFNDALVPPEIFAPLGWPLLLVHAVVEAPWIGVPSLMGAAAAGIAVLSFGGRLKRPKLAVVIAPVVAAAFGWLLAEAVFAWQMPHAAENQFGDGYCLTGMGSATQSLRYGVGLSGYRHAETTDRDTPYHWSFKAGKFVPEDHWGRSGYVWQRTCPAGSHMAKDARRM